VVLISCTTYNAPARRLRRRAPPPPAAIRRSIAMCVATPGTRRRLTKWRRREPRLRGVSRLSPGS